MSHHLPDIPSVVLSSFPRSPSRPIRSASTARPGKYQLNNAKASSYVPSSPVVFVPQSPKLCGQLQATLVSDVTTGLSADDMDGNLVNQWAAKNSLKLKDSLSALLNRSQPATTSKRAERAIYSLRILSENMKSYKDIFDALADDIKLIASELSDATEINSTAQAKFDSQMRAKDQSYQLATIELTNEVGMLKRQIQDTAEAAALVKIRDQQLDQKAAEIETVRMANAKREEDIALARRTQDVLFTQFAVRNKGLQEEIDVAHKSAQDNKTKADELSGICQRYAQRVYRLEQNAIEATRQHETTVRSITNALKASQVESQRLSSALGNLRTLKRTLDDELADTKRRLDAALAELAEGKILNTPRPSFRLTTNTAALEASHADEPNGREEGQTSPSKPSTISQVQDLYEQLDRNTNELWSVQAQLEVSRKTLKVSEILTRAIRSSPLAGADNQPISPSNVPMGVLVIPFSAPSLASTTVGNNRLTAKAYSITPSEPLPLMMITSAPVVQVRAWSLSETIRRVKECFDVWATQNNRTTKSVELHTAIAVNLLDTAALAAAHTGGNAPTPSTSVVPNAVAELMYTLQFNARIWGSNAIIASFRAILQEEVGVWMWGAQNKFIATHLCRLSKLGATATFADLRESLESALLSEGFVDVDIEPVVRQFGRSYIPDTILRDHKKTKTTIDEAEVPVRVDATPFMPFLEPKGSTIPTSVNINESAAVQSLRFLYHRRLQQFYQRMDAELIHRVNQEDWNPTTGSSKRNKVSKFSPQHPSALGVGGLRSSVTSPHSPLSSSHAAPAPPNSISEPVALQCLKEAIVVSDLLSAERFIKDVFRACRTQHKLEYARVKENSGKPEYCGGSAMASHQVFLPGYTAHYFAHQYSHYPTLQVALDMMLVEGQSGKKSKKKVGIPYGDGTDREFISVSDGNFSSANFSSTTNLATQSSSPNNAPPQPAWQVEDLKEYVPLILFLRMYRKIAFVPTGLRTDNDSDNDCY